MFTASDVRPGQYIRIILGDPEWIRPKIVSGQVVDMEYTGEWWFVDLMREVRLTLLDEDGEFEFETYEEHPVDIL